MEEQRKIENYFNLQAESNVDFKPFFDMYKNGDIVYPNAVARHFGISPKKAYKVCEERKKAGILRNLYMITCPVCKNTATQQRFYSLEPIDTEEEIGCCHCDCEFLPRLDSDVTVLYEKIGTPERKDMKKFAKSISDRDLGFACVCGFIPLTREEVKIAKEKGFVVVYGESDDLIEFEGALYDEGGCYDGGDIYFSKTGVWQGKDEDKAKYPNHIRAIWGKDDITWQYETDIPHETFRVMDGGEVYCIGLVFHIDDLK